MGRPLSPSPWIALGVAGVLAAVLAVETLPGTQAPQAAPIRLAAASTMPASALQVAATSPVEEWMDTVLDRPLFAPDRRPPANAAAQGELPRLAGTIRFANTALAIFETNPSDAAKHDKTVTLGLGARVSGWTLTEIANGSVTIVRNDRVERLELGYAKHIVVSHSVSLAAITVLHDKRTSPFLQP